MNAATIAPRRVRRPLRAEVPAAPKAGAAFAAQVRALWELREQNKARVAAYLTGSCSWHTPAELAAALGLREGQAAELADELVCEGAADLHATAGCWLYSSAGAPVPGPGGLTWVSVLNATLRAALGRDLKPDESPLALWAAWAERAERAAPRRPPAPAAARPLSPYEAHICAALDEAGITRPGDRYPVAKAMARRLTPDERRAIIAELAAGLAQETP